MFGVSGPRTTADALLDRWERLPAPVAFLAATFLWPVYFAVLIPHGIRQRPDIATVLLAILVALPLIWLLLTFGPSATGGP